VLLAHGFGGSKDDLEADAEELARAGYAVLTYSARGFGRSTGKVALNSPDYEVKDVKALLDWLAKRPEVRQDGAGDPRVGIAGASYGGAIALLAALAIAYFAGGYVAGRMSRFDGGRQGLGTWIIGLIVTIGLALAAVILGDEYNLLEQLNLPSLPVGDQSFATGGIIALAAILIGSLLAAMFGGKVGERYHKRVDRAGFVD
jgi:pimeloyl-ACP methyl ester carboxylesterase